MYKQMNTSIFYPDMYARHGLIIKSACLWLEDVISIQSIVLAMSKDDEARSAGLQLRSGYVGAVLLKVLHQPRQKRVVGDRLGVAHERTLPPGTRHRNIRAAPVSQEADAPGRIGAHHGDHNRLLLPACMPDCMIDQHIA